MRGRKKFHFSVSITCSLSTTLYFHLLQTERNGGGGQPNASRCVLNGSFSGAVMHKKQANGTKKRPTTSWLLNMPTCNQIRYFTSSDQKLQQRGRVGATAEDGEKCAFYLSSI